jgi:DNA polymerase III epsilon subunit-like protein
MPARSPKKAKKLPDRKLVIDWKKAAWLCEAGCKTAEIVATMGVSYDTFLRRCAEDNDITFSNFRLRHRARGDAILTEKQYKIATGMTMKGDKTMLMWLGKNRLGQRDRTETTGTVVSAEVTKQDMKEIDEERRKEINGALDDMIAGNVPIEGPSRSSEEIEE